MGVEEMMLDMERKHGFERGERYGLERGEKRGLKRGMERGMERGMKQVKIEIVTNMLNHDFSDEMIVKATGVTPDFINKIRILNKE